MEIYNDIPESKDPGIQRTLEDPGPLRTQDPRGSRTLGDLETWTVDQFLLKHISK